MRRVNNWIAGSWRPAADGRYAESNNPANGEVLGELADSGTADADAAIITARDAFDSTAWAQSPRLRAKVLLDFAARLEERIPQIAELLTLEHGKPISHAKMEVVLSVSELRFYAGLARTVFGRVMEVEADSYSMLTREPMGVAGIIVPWNAPLILLMRSLAPALAAGCTCVVKAAPQTALTNAAVFEILAQVADLPPGVVNMFSETGSDGARALVASHQVGVISYTGSTEVGKLIMRDGAGTLKRMNLELGGSAPCLLLPDAGLDRAVPSLVFAGMFISGQQCVAASRLIVHETIADEVKSRFSSALAKVVVGRGSDPQTQMGPMIDARSRDRIVSLIENTQEGVEWLLRGEVPGGELARGHFITPSLAAVSDPAGLLVNCEVFGPIMTVQTYRDEEDALAMANRTPFGLAASVWTRDLAKAQHMARRIDSGTVWLNKHGQLHAEIETGGYKESGLGRLHGVEGLSEFLQTKHTSWETAA